MKAVVVLGTWVFVLPAIGAQSQPSRVPFVQASADDLSLELVSEPASYDRPSSDEFTELDAVSRCSQAKLRAIEVTLGWEVRRSQREAHRVDISKFHDGFAKGQYLTSGERPAAERQLLFEDAEPGLYYYWRVLTKGPEGWVVSGNGRFETPICPVDRVPE